MANLLLVDMWSITDREEMEKHSKNEKERIWKDKLSCIDGLVQDCSNSIANALELLQSCTKPSI